jgi:uridine kinase
MPRQVSPAAAIRAIAAAVEGRGEQTRWIGVDGPGGAGKSSFAERVAAAVPGVVVVSVDEFSGPDVTEWDWVRFDRELVEPLRTGRAGRYRRWEWRSETAGDWREVPTGSVVLVEGVSATRSEVAAPWTLRVWVDAPRELRLERVLTRDGPAVMARWLEDWIPSEEAYVARERPKERADLIVAGY